MSGVGTAALITAGTGVYSASQQGKGNNQAGHGFDTWMAPQWDFTEGNMNRLSDQYNNDLSRSNAGQLPGWYQQYAPQIEAAKRKRLRQDYYGSGTTPSMFQGAMDTGAVMGLGPKQGMAQQQKVYQDYINQSSAIDDYMSTLGYDVASKAQGNALAGMRGLTQGPNSQAIPWQQSAAGGDGGAGLMETFGGMLGGGFKGFGKTTTPGMPGMPNYGSLDKVSIPYEPMSAY